MRVTKLRLKGFIGIKKGMGRDEIEIDFSNTSGLIAIAGPNGNGKTTILDSMQPFRTLASRKRSLQHHVFLRDSEKELEFDFNGDQYRSLIKIDAGSDRTEGFLWKNGESLVDGKVTNYDQEIIKLFGSPALFFNSVFCAQNSEKLNEMTTGDLKKLFSEFLRLDKLIEWENTSKQCANILGDKLDSLEINIDRLTQTTKDKEDVAIKLSSATTQLEMGMANLKKLEGERDIKQDELAQAQAAIQKNALLRDREKELQAERDAIKKEAKAFDEKVELEISENKSKRRDTEIEIMGLDSLLANEKEIREAAKRAKELTEIIEETRKHGVEAREEEKETEARYQAISKNTSKAKLKAIEHGRDAGHKIDKLQTRIWACKEKMSDLDKKDPACKSTICSFIVGALEAEGQLPALEKELSELQEASELKANEYQLEYDLLKDNLKEVEKELEEKHLVIEDITKTYKSLDQGLKKVQPLANDLARVEVATQRRSDLVKWQEELKGQQGKIRIDAKIAKEKLRKKRLSIDGKLDEVQKQTDEGAEERIVNIRKRNDELITAIKAYNDDALPTLKADIETYGRRLEEIEVAEDEWEKTKILADTYLCEMSDWTYLKNACSKDGLRALEIDSVAPVVTGYANDLLTSTFGPSSTVRFRTQDPETGREVLDILVIREDGSEVLLDNLSGGEKVWNLKALTLGLTLVSKEKSGTNYLSAMADEEDGSLDVENARNFVSLYRSFMPIGRFEDLYFISHKPECVAMADHVISLNGTGIEVS